MLLIFLQLVWMNPNGDKSLAWLANIQLMKKIEFLIKMAFIVIKQLKHYQIVLIRL